MAYSRWDVERQFAPVRVKLDRNLAALVVQENVFGKGKVLFSETYLSFTDWYEQTSYGDNILSWMIGMKASEHARKVERLHGGPGEPVRRASR